MISPSRKSLIDAGESLIIFPISGEKEAIPKKNRKQNMQIQAENILKILPANKIQIFLNKLSD